MLPTWPELVSLGVEILVVATTAGLAVWRAVLAGLDSKINGMEGRLSSRLDSVDGDLHSVEGKIDDLSARVRRNSQNIAVLSDRWDRGDGPYPDGGLEGGR